MRSSPLRLFAALAGLCTLLASCSVVNAPSDVQPFAGSGGQGVGPGGGGPGGGGPGGGGPGGAGGQGGLPNECGDGRIDVALGETCDPPATCPTSCDDGDACTIDELNGSPTTCDVVCDITPVIACNGGDGCCPAGCDQSIDGDCQSVSVLLLTTYPPAGDDTQAKQSATGAFSVINVFDLLGGTPSLDELMVYDVVLVFPDIPGMDPAAFGDNLADYYDAGGRVVLSSFAMTSGILQGRFGDPAQGYLLVTPGPQDQQADSLGPILEPGSPLMQDVTTLTAEAAYRSTGAPVPGTTVVATWANGIPLVVRGMVQGRNRVDINMYPGSNDVPGLGFWVGDGTALIRNALLFQ